MRIDPAVRKETLIIGAGTLALSALMVVVSVLIGKFDMTVVYGALLGSAAAILNFFLMGLAVQKAAGKINGGTADPTAADEAADEAAEDEVTGENSTGTSKKLLTPEGKKAKHSMQISYMLRMAMLIVICVLGAALPVFNVYSTLLPMLFPRVVLTIQGLLMKKEA